MKLSLPEQEILRDAFLSHPGTKWQTVEINQWFYRWLHHVNPDGLLQKWIHTNGDLVMELIQEVHGRTSVIIGLTITDTQAWLSISSPKEVRDLATLEYLLWIMDEQRSIASGVPKAA